MSLKDFLWAIITVCTLFTISYPIHSHVLECIPFSGDCALDPSYIFHFFFSLIVGVAFTFMANSEKLFPQLGFIYLGILAFKLLLYAAIFRDQISTSPEEMNIPAGNYIIPVFVGLLSEIIVLKRLLNISDTKS